MNATAKLHEPGQSLWLDNIAREMLDTGTLQHYIADLSVTGLTSNPTIFEQAIATSPAYDAAIHAESGDAKSSEEISFDLALEDITRAADLFLPVYERTNGVDGWVSLEIATHLQEEGARSFVEPWNDLLAVIESKSTALAGQAH